MGNIFKDYINQFIKAKELPGLGVGIVKDGKVILAEGFGVRSILDPKTVLSKSCFHLASVSKPFAATGIMQLVEKGKIKLDAPLTEYLPYFKMDDDRLPQVTIGRILNHTSGMPDVDDYEWGNPYMEEDAAEKYVRSLANEKLKFDPGSEFAYSNIAFDIFADVIAKVTGISFEEYMKREIFMPLGMKDSTFFQPEVPEKLRVSPHTRVFDNEVSAVYPYNRTHAPSSTINSNPEDMCRWIMANLQRGILDGKRILSDATYDLLWKPTADRAFDQQVGISWFIGTQRELVTIGHGGSDLGFRSYLLMIPEKSAGVMVMCNLNPAPVEELTKGLMDLVLGFHPQAPLKPVLFVVGQTYRDQGIKAALEQMNELFKNHLGEYDFDQDQFVYLGNALLNKKELDKAVDILKIGLELHPQSARIFAGLALIYHFKGEQELSRQNLAQAKSIDPEDFIVKYLLGLVQ
jgi:CubicO group peptidase (beta-lactamase class C family)